MSSWPLFVWVLAANHTFAISADTSEARLPILYDTIIVGFSNFLCLLGRLWLSFACWCNFNILRNRDPTVAPAVAPCRLQKRARTIVHYISYFRFSWCVPGFALGVPSYLNCVSTDVSLVICEFSRVRPCVSIPSGGGFSSISLLTSRSLSSRNWCAWKVFLFLIVIRSSSWMFESDVWDSLWSFSSGDEVV